MKHIEKKPLFYPIEIGEMKCKVFVVGSGPRLKKRAKNERDPISVSGTHTHFAYEAFFVTEGSLQIVTRDFTKSYENEVVILPPRTQHHSLPDCDGSFCLLFAAEEGTSAETVLKKRIGDGICRLPLEDDVSFYIKRLTERRAEDDPAAARDEALLVALIFNRIFSHLLPAGNAQPHRAVSAEHINEIEHYINHHLSQKITLSDLSQRVYLSTKQVSRIIERAFGCTFSELVTNKRLAAAEMMLKNTDMSVAEIAATFCTSEAYFFVLFKKKYGISPLKYRKESRNF